MKNLSNIIIHNSPKVEVTQIIYQVINGQMKSGIITVKLLSTIKIMKH
jgi:hypothetical protein